MNSKQIETKAEIIHRALVGLTEETQQRLSSVCPSARGVDVKVSTRFEFCRFEITCENHVEDFIHASSGTFEGALKTIEEKLSSYADLAASKRAKAAQLIAEADAITAAQEKENFAQ